MAWDWWGWDRSSVGGAARFALVTFGLIVAALAFLELAWVPGLVAPAVASERDRKSLDSLLATPLSGAEVVLGAAAAGLLRWASGFAALGPAVALAVYFGGVDPRLVLLAVAGLASTAVVLAALSVAVSAGARTAQRAVTVAVGLAMAWTCLPVFLVMFLPRVWRAAVPWVAPVALWVLDSSPSGVGLNLLGAIAHLRWSRRC